MVAGTMITNLFLAPLKISTSATLYRISHLRISHLHTQCLTSSRFKVEFTVQIQQDAPYTLIYAEIFECRIHKQIRNLTSGIQFLCVCMCVGECVCVWLCFSQMAWGLAGAVAGSELSWDEMSRG